MRFEILGNSVVVRALVTSLRHAQFVVNEGRAVYTAEIIEMEPELLRCGEPDYPSVSIDAVEGPFEALAVRFIAEATQHGGVWMQRRGGNLSDRRLRIEVPANDRDREAIEVGLFRAFCELARMPSVSARPWWIRAIRWVHAS